MYSGCDSRSTTEGFTVEGKGKLLDNNLDSSV